MHFYSIGTLLIFSEFVFFSEVSAYTGDLEPYTEDDLPKLFAMDNYKDCTKKHGTFCKVNFGLEPHDKTSKLAKLIEKSKHSDNRFERQYIHRLICFEKDILKDNFSMRNHATEAIQKELQQLNLTKADVNLSVRDVHCGGSFSMGIFDYIFWMAVPLYMYLIFKSTKYDLNKQKNADYPSSKYESLYNVFAIRRNWEKIMNGSKSQDYKRLKCIQGMRFYVTSMMLINHTKLSYGLLYFQNPIDFEKTCANPLFYMQIIFDMLFIIQTYLMISSFLMTNQILEIKRKDGYFSLYHGFVLLINRIVRFFPSVLVMVSITVCGSKLVTVGPHVNDFIYTVQEACQTAWWTPLVQLGFLKKFEEMCVPGSWYTSVDTLFYATGMVILYFQLRYNLSLNKILAACFAVFSTMFAYTIYVNDFPAIFKVNADVFLNLYNSPEFNKLYISPFSSYSTMCVGVWFGSLYFYTKNQKHQTNTVKNLISNAAIMAAVPMLVIVADAEYHGRSIRALIGPFVKPAFASLSALVILRLSRKQGGIFNRIFEWDFAVKMGNFTFSTYIFHFFLVFQRGALETELFIFKTTNLIFVTIFNLVASYALGIFCSLIIEQPFATLQKKYLPQVKNPPFETNGVQSRSNEKTD